MSSPIRVFLADGRPEGDSIAEELESADSRFSVYKSADVSAVSSHLVDTAIDCIVLIPGNKQDAGVEVLRSIRDQEQDVPTILCIKPQDQETIDSILSMEPTDVLQYRESISVSLLIKRIQYVSNVALPDEAYASPTKDQQLDILWNLSRIISDNQEDVTSIIDELLALGVSELGFDIGYLTKIEDDQQQVVKSVGSVERFTSSESVPLEDTFCKTVVESHEPVIIADSVENGWQNDSAIRHYSFGAYAGAPIYVQDELYGTICFADESRISNQLVEFLEPLLSQIAAWIGTAKEEEIHNIERQRYEQMVNESGDIIYATDADGILTAVNKAAANFVGYSTADLLGLDASSLTTPAGAKETEEVIRKLIRNGQESATFEIEIETVDGQTIPCENHVTILVGENGTFNGHVGVIRDISDRLERQHELEQYETLMRILPDSVVVTDLDGIITNVYGREQVTGHTPEELVGSNISELMPPDSIERAEEVATDLILNDDRQLGSYEATLHSRDGSIIPCEIHMAPLPQDDDGWIPGTISIIHDISELKERERELQRFETILDRLPDAVYIYDDNGECLYVNQTAINAGGMPEEWYINEYIGNLLEPALDSEQYLETVDAMESLISGEESQIRTTLTFQMEHSEIHADSISSRISGSDGEFLGVVSVLRDITEQIEAERELRRQNDRLEQFSKVVSHDLRNPINVAKGRLVLAQEECESEHLEPIDQSLDRMVTLISDLLELGRAGETVRSVEAVQLQSLCRTCWENVETNDATLEIEDVGLIHADPSRLKQLLENLYRNAIEHGGNDVTVTVGSISGTQGIFIEDDGPGIPESDREYIFQSGYSTTDGGTGFGLSIVKEIVDAHDWDITIKDGTNAGARFEITGIETEE